MNVFFRLFHSQWLRGQPVLVSNSSKRLDMKLWHPRAFLNDFGHLHHDLINCLSGKLVPQASLKKFWEESDDSFMENYFLNEWMNICLILQGFEDTKHRFKDFRGAPMLLKLKDWPPSEDIAEFMPKRFKNLFDSFPLPGLDNLLSVIKSKPMTVQCYLNFRVHKTRGTSQLSSVSSKLLFEA